MKICTTCKREFPEEMFHQYKRRGETRYSQCRDCKSSYKATPEARERQKERSRKRRENASEEDKTKRMCWNRVYYRLKTGEIVKSVSCQVCGIECETQAHHSDYTKPLVIIWCCQVCHAKLDNERRTSV
jgi:hypothetical protein